MVGIEGLKMVDLLALAFTVVGVLVLMAASWALGVYQGSHYTAKRIADVMEKQ